LLDPANYEEEFIEFFRQRDLLGSSIQISAENTIEDVLAEFNKSLTETYFGPIERR